MRTKVVQLPATGSRRSVDAELSEALTAVRIGDYDRADEILAGPSFEELRQARTTADWKDLAQLRYVTLRAEILDRQAKYKEAAKWIRPYAASAHEALGFEADRHLRRQQLFCIVQCAVTRYRDRKLDEAEQLLTAAMQAAHAMQPPSEGLLTQLDYALAKLHLRRGQLREATMLFRRSADSASRRFNRYVHPARARAITQEKRRTELRAARYRVGIAMSLGLGHCLVQSGLLDEARTVLTAGLLILDGTVDHVHRYYARLLLGMAEHASAATGDTELLASARDHLNDALRFFRQRRPTLAYRARCELALIELALRGNPAAARKIVAPVASQSSAHRRRWKAQALITLAHIAIHEGRHAEAIRRAQEASRVAMGDSDEETVDTEARITLAEAYAAAIRTKPRASVLTAAERHVRRLVRDLRDESAHQLALPLLLLSQICIRRENIRGAMAAYHEFTRLAPLVQSRRIGEVAKEVREELFPQGPPLLLPVDRENPSYLRDENLQAVRRHLAEAVSNRHPEANETALSELLGGKHFYPRLVARAWPKRRGRSGRERAD